MKKMLTVLLVLAITLSGCSLPSLSLFKKVIQHPKPELSIDNSYFTGLGCFEDVTCLPPELQQIEYPINSLQPPGDILGGLDPVYPLAVGTRVHFADDPEIPAVHVMRCLGRQYVRYVVLVNDEMVLVDSLEKLAQLYAPIDSENEALSYAIAATGYTAVYDLHNTPRLKFYQKPIEETNVMKTGDGYKVHLFATYLCGCGPHIDKSVDVTVHTDGTIDVSELQDAYRDPKLDGLCID